MAKLVEMNAVKDAIRDYAKKEVAAGRFTLDPVYDIFQLTQTVDLLPAVETESYDTHWSNERAYKNGYSKGYTDGKTERPFDCIKDCANCWKTKLVTARWTSVGERLPNKEEYTAKAKDGAKYYERFLIAYKTDVVEYEIGYYDGHKWMTEMPIRIIKDVLAWMPFPNLSQPPKGE